jgi:hypothetical protein|tara:strand:+ start:1329 stop:2048 length:720 start_codon:yes stop_codon:yes gene_type:complete
MLNHYLNVLPIYFLELLAILTGFYFLFKRKTNKWNKGLVYFLMFIVFIELIASYAVIGFFSDYHCFSFVENTLFENNTWVYNCFMLLEFIFFILYFRYYIKSCYWKNNIKIAVIIFIVTAILNLLLTNIFFRSYSQTTIIFGTLLLLITVFRFYFELLNSDDVLNIKRYLPLYISIGILIFYLCFSPLSIYSNYYKIANKLFMKVFSNGLLFANLFKYLIFSLGFLVCSKNMNNELNEK